MKRLEQIVAIFIAAGLAIPSYWFFWTLAGGGGYDRRVKPNNSSFLDNSSLQTTSNFNKP
tara:strand:- start:4 stop:183 length:180 start_codon:yes stop_codon:yes gene_type:complete